MASAHRTYQTLGTTRRLGFWKLFPWTGTGSLLLALCCGVAALVIGIISDGLPQNSWNVRTGTIQPSVLLSFAATIANALLRIAFAEGVIFQWWSQAHQGVSIGQLCALYAQGFSSRGLVTTLSKFSKVTFAALAMILLLADGPLLQRASSIQKISHHSSQNLTVPISSSPFVVGATAIINEHDADIPNMYTTAFAQVIQRYGTRDAISIPRLNNSGTLTMDLVGPGWDIHCENTSSPYRLMSPEDWTQQQSSNSTYDGPPWLQTMFKIEIAYGVVDGYGLYDNRRIDLLTARSGSILIQAYYKSTPGFNGTLSTRNCSLNEALIRYPLRVVNGVVMLQDMPLSVNRTEHLIYRQSEVNTWGTTPSTVGGIYIALLNQFNTSARIEMVTSSSGSKLVNDNAVASQFLLPDTNLQDDASNVFWSDPMDTVNAAANEITLRAAIELTNWSSLYEGSATLTQPEVWYPNLTDVNRTLSQKLSAAIETSGNVYQTNLAWLVSGFAMIALTCIAIIPLYWGWWRLDRTFTLDPLETAKAFDAPLLRDASANVSPAVWGRSLEQMRVCYGSDLHKTPDYEMSDSEAWAYRPVKVFSVDRH